MAQITIEHVSKTYATRYEAVCAVRELNLAIADRELLVLVGPSGCGKTTTLRLIAGLEEASAGQIRIGKRIVNDVAPRDRDVAMVFQNHALYPHLTVHRNLAFGLEARGERRDVIEARVREAARMLGVTPFLGRKPATLSAGERQRVALGRAIVRRPEVFLLDEPLANLDATLRRQMRIEIKRIQREQAITMIYVTHDQEEAMALGDRLGILREGVLQQVGAPLELYRRPANRFVAGFMGSPPMSFIVGTLFTRDGSVQVECVLGRCSIGTPGGVGTDSQTGRPVTLGLRAEHLIVEKCVGRSDSVAHKAGACLMASARVDFCEPQGRQTLVYLSCQNGENLVAAAAPTTLLRPGETAKVRIDAGEVHIFDSDENETGLAFATVPLA